MGHSPGVGYPSSCFIPDKLLSLWRVSSGHQPDSLSPGLFTLFTVLCAIKIFTILCTRPCTINNKYFTLSYSTILFTIIFYISSAWLNCIANFNFFLLFLFFPGNTTVVAPGFSFILRKANFNGRNPTHQRSFFSVNTTFITMKRRSQAPSSSLRQTLTGGERPYFLKTKRHQGTQRLWRHFF